jgi:hypothetical protein
VAVQHTPSKSHGEFDNAHLAVAYYHLQIGDSACFDMW